MRYALVVAVAILAGGCGHNSSAAGDDDDGGNSDGGGGGDDDGGGNQGFATVKLTLNHRPANGAQFSFIVAYRDGAGPWTLSDMPTGDDYSFHIYSPVYSVMWTCIGASAQNATIRQVSMMSFAVSDRTSLSADVPPRCAEAAGLVTLHGTLANGGFTDNYVVRWGDRQATVANGSYTMQVPPGTHDLVLLEASSISIGDAQPSGAFVKRNVTVNAATEVDLDANGVEDLQAFDVSDLDGGTKQSATTTLYAAGTTAPLATQTSGSYTVMSLATDQMGAGDIYDLQLSETSGTAMSTRTLATATPGELTWTDVPTLGAVATSVGAAQPYPQLQSSWPMYANATGYTWAITQTATSGPGTATIVWAAQLSPSVLGAAPAFEMPDFSQLGGWNPSLQLVAGKAVVGGVQAQVSSATGDFPPITPPPAGTKRTMASTTFALTP
ncbi:MAG: hypothetical protein QM831_06715 [Kofleriaceae bacterium]